MATTKIVSLRNKRVINGDKCALAVLEVTEFRLFGRNSVRREERDVYIPKGSVFWRYLHTGKYIPTTVEEDLKRLA